MAKEAGDTVEVTSRKVFCDGGEGPLGHPRVYLKIGPSGAVDCPYCGRRFMLKEGAVEAAAH